jgi:hypothetical protein
MSQFTAAELAAQDAAFVLHRDGKCADDCGFCYDLLLAGEEKYSQELRRIQGIKAASRNKPLHPPRPKKGKSAPLKSRVRG